MTDTMAWTIIVTLCLTIVVLAYLMFVAVREILFLREDLQQAADTEHAKCMGAVMEFVGNEWAAQVLDVAADDYDAPSGSADMERIRRFWKQGDAPVPSIWLRQRADRLRIESAPVPEEVGA